MYNEKVMDHFEHPRNVGESATANAIGEMESRACGDTTIVYLDVEDNRIKDIHFKTYGCAAAIASSSILTEMVKGKTLEEAEAITTKQIVDELGGLPPAKIHCSVLAGDALKKAIDNYRAEHQA